ncbi:MAG: ribosome biogenesis GTPase Der [Chloroflexi bacterium]|nr:ribosome biogenesis GTPase Der [Chloroflexota bacterium]
MRDVPMEGLPIVAIVGRPNVGKSTLFNRIVGGRTAIVEDRARTTRDRLYAPAEWNARRFVVVDTGGLERRPGDPIEEKVQDQARLAIAEADLIVFVVDAASGETPSDAEAAEILRLAGAPVLVAINKADNERRELEGAEFHRLGWDETYAVSALHGRGVADLLDAVIWALPPEAESEVTRKRLEEERLEEAEWAAMGLETPMPEAVTEGAANGAGRGDAADGKKAADDAEGSHAAAGVEEAAAPVPARVAIVGRPNVGKSSLLNSLLGEERVIVSDIPGTTRDAIDTSLTWEGREVRLVDTAGIRRRGKVASGPAYERFSALRAIRAIGRADVAILVLDEVDVLTAQDAHVAGYVIDEGVGLVIAINKWDLVEKDQDTFDEYVGRIRRDAAFLQFAPVVAISALTGLRVSRALTAALLIADERRRRVTTPALNKVITEATYRQPAPPVKGKRPRFYYATQAAIEPPTFVLFASEAGSVHFSYRRYLENRIREEFGFSGTPIKLIFRERSRIEMELKRGKRPTGRRAPKVRGKTTARRSSAERSRR